MYFISDGPGKIKGTCDQFQIPTSGVEYLGNRTPSTEPGTRKSLRNCFLAEKGKEINIQKVIKGLVEVLALVQSGVFKNLKGCFHVEIVFSAGAPMEPK